MVENSRRHPNRNYRTAEAPTRLRAAPDLALNSQFLPAPAHKTIRIGNSGTGHGVALFEQIKAGTLAGAPVIGGSIDERIAKETDVSVGGRG